MVRRLNFTDRVEDMEAGLRRIVDMQIRSVGIDLGQTTFHRVALGDNGKVLVKKKFTSLPCSRKTRPRKCAPEQASIPINQ
jgi:hypothetical protein